MCEEKEGVMRNAMTTRAPGGAKNAASCKAVWPDVSLQFKSTVGCSNKSFIVHRTHKSSPVLFILAVDFFPSGKNLLQIPVDTELPKWGHVDA